MPDDDTQTIDAVETFDADLERMRTDLAALEQKLLSEIQTTEAPELEESREDQDDPEFNQESVLAQLADLQATDRAQADEIADFGRAVALLDLGLLSTTSLAESNAAAIDELDSTVSQIEDDLAFMRGDVDQNRFILDSIQVEGALKLEHYADGSLLFINENSGGSDRWPITQVAATTVDVGNGNWTRWGILNTWTTGGSDVTGLSSNGTFYIYTQLADAATRDGDLVSSGTLTVNKSTLNTWPESSGGSSFVTTNKIRVLGEVVVASNVISTITQYEDSDFDDQHIKPDDASANTGTDPYLQTMGFNPTANIHQRELGLYNSWSTVDGTGIPVSEYRIPGLEKDGNGTGPLDWWVMDADAGGAGAGSQRSMMRFNDGTRLVGQLYDFNDAGSPSSLAAADRVGVRDATGPKLMWPTLSDFAAWVGAEMNSIGVITHTGLDYSGSVAGTGVGNSDHHFDYWLQNGTFTHCWAQTIGDDTTSVVGGHTQSDGAVIDLGNKTLRDYQAVDAPAGLVIVDWEFGQGKLYNTTADFVADLAVTWANRNSGAHEWLANPQKYVSFHLDVSTTGTIGADRFLLDDHAESFWNKEQLDVFAEQINLNASAAAGITIDSDHASADIEVHSDRALLLESVDDLRLQPTAELEIWDGSGFKQGKTGTFEALDAGDTVDVEVTHGIITAWG